jgi:hypothetical protein
LAIEYGSVESTLRKRMNPPPAEIGAPVAEVETPALLIDLDAFDLAKMAEFAGAAGVRVRPTPRPTSRLRLRYGRSLSARSANACRRSAKRKCSFAAV